MITKHTLLHLVVLLSVSLSDGLDVVQPESSVVNADGSVTIACELLDWPADVLEMQAGLKRQRNSTAACEVSVKSSAYVYNPAQPGCAWRRSPPNGFLFTLFHLEPGDAELYVCHFTKMIPPPVKNFLGRGTKLVFPEEKPTPVTSAPTVMQCPEPGLLNWVLMGLAVFLLLSCLMVTCAYIRQRGKQSKDDDSLTYVPMQPSQSQTGNKRRGDPESNTTYMDMRKMQLGGRTSGRDMNYNSHQVTY